jgi:tRNA threonylcarbamoyladenosine biosynthesis protein TsaE
METRKHSAIVWAAAARSEGTVLLDDNATRAAASRLAQVWAPQTGALLTLSGDLGAGKTSFAQAFFKTLGVKGRIRSPSFTLAETYNLPGLGVFLHFDCYRFRQAREWLDAGFDEQLATAQLSLVEWPSLAAPHLPLAEIALTLEIEPHPHQPEIDARRLRASAHTATGRAWLERAANS